jgi:phosphoglycolate phosphatase-like HAD superfamily hydrolase
MTGGAGQRAMARAFENLFAVPDAFRNIPMPGRTDAGILADAAAAHGVAVDDLSPFRDLYVALLTEEIEQPSARKRVMPGVRILLEQLAARPDTFLALLTGNYERGAEVKLRHFDLWRFFRCGAFGDSTLDRNHLLPAVLERIGVCGGPVDPSDTVVIGDTPLDVACAAAGGARSIAVATGGYDVETLRQAGAAVVFEDLSDTEAVLAEILSG